MFVNQSKTTTKCHMVQGNLSHYCFSDLLGFYYSPVDINIVCLFNLFTGLETWNVINVKLSIHV